MTAAEASAVRFQWGVRIPLRDGIHLNATLYLPRGQDTSASCILLMTPYISDSFHDRGMYFAARGLAFIIVDVRGRGNSEGIFRPSIQEARDGYDTIEWLASQPWCNGKVAMWGGSYSGYAQWAAAKEFPPHLATIVPAAAPYYGVDFPMRSNIFCPYLLRWLTFTSGRARQSLIFADHDFWSALYRRWHESGRAFSEFDHIVGNPSPIFQEWLEHPRPDAYWDTHNPTTEEYARLELPVLSITGCYDDDQPGALEHYRRHLRLGSLAAGKRHYLIIGPWDHAGTRTPRASFGGLTVGPASLIDLPELHLQWYAWTMQGGPRPEFLQKPVAWYVMGADRWSYADTLDDATKRYDDLHLDSTNGANAVFASGSLQSSPASGGPDSYTYDPRRVDGPEIEVEACVPGDVLTDQALVLALGGRSLVYHSAPFAADTEVTGFFRLHAWIAIDCPDTDLYASIYEIDTEGNSLRLTTDAIRARYREDLRSEVLIDTREPLTYRFERFTFISRLIRRGCRLRLVIAPTGRIVESNFTEKNYNAGGAVARESAGDARAVTVTLFHDREHASVLFVPIGHGEQQRERSW